MKKVIDSSPPTPYWMLKDAGIYDVQSSSDNANEWWIDIEVFMDKGKLWFINPYNDKLVAVKGMHGWLFRRRKNAMEALPTHHTTAKGCDKETATVQRTLQAITLHERQFNMRRREVDKKLQSIQIALDKIGERKVMSRTSSGNGFGDQLRMFTFRIGCCRAALDIKEGVELQRKALFF